MVMLKWILKKQTGVSWTALVCLNIAAHGQGDCPTYNSHELLGSIKIISGLDEELELPKDKFCTTGLVKILRYGAVKKYTLVHIYKGNIDIKMNGQEGIRQPLNRWSGKGTWTHIMKEWISYLPDGTSIISTTSPSTPMLTAVKR